MIRLRLTALSLLVLLIALGGCVRRGDSLAPIITITDPASGTVRSAENLRISGYALDDEGIVAIRVDGTDLLSSSIYQGERGKRLIHFAFEPRLIDEGQWASVIEVEDQNQRVSRLNYEIEIDTTPPELTLNPIERLANNQLRVSGIARDNNQLARIMINDYEVPFSRGPQATFSLDIPAANTVTITVYDEAGNQVTETRQP